MSNFLRIEMNFKNLDEDNYFSWSNVCVMSSFNSMILEFKDIKMVWCSVRNFVIFSFTTALQSCE